MTYLFENPDASKFLERCFHLLMKEADRGCVLLGVSMLDEELTNLFEKMLPEGTSNKRKKDIFNFSGPFGTISSKLDVAYVCNILPPDLIDSIHKLRKLRNNLAHEPAPFTIKENLEAVYEVFSAVKGNLAAGASQLSLELIYERYIQAVLEAEHPLNDGKKLFETREEAINYVSVNEDIKCTLSEQRIKAMFVIGVSTLAALIIFHRDKANANKL